MDTDLGGAGVDDDHSRSLSFLWRLGTTQERARHDHAQLHHRRGH